MSTDRENPAAEDREEQAARDQIRRIKEVKEKQEMMAGKTNQDMVNVLYEAAKELGMGEWTLIQQVELTHLADDRSAAYSGPAPANMPGIDDKQKSVIQKVLENYKRPEK
jgi:hypothetical protein